MKIALKDMLANLTAVLVDDSPDQLAKMQGILQRIGVRVLATAKNGHLGLSAIARLKPSIALLDVVMPQFTGIDVLRELHARKVPTIAIMCTSMHLDNVRKQCDEFGAAGFIVKPYDDILTTIELRELLPKLFEPQE